MGLGPEMITPQGILPARTEFISYEAYARQQPVTQPRVALESLYWQPPMPLEKTSLPSRIRVAVVGSHATLSLEPVEMLRRFLTGNLVGTECPIATVGNPGCDFLRIPNPHASDLRCM